MSFEQIKYHGISKHHKDEFVRFTIGEFECDYYVSASEIKNIDNAAKASTIIALNMAKRAATKIERRKTPKRHEISFSDGIEISD